MQNNYWWLLSQNYISDNCLFVFSKKELWCFIPIKSYSPMKLMHFKVRLLLSAKGTIVSNRRKRTYIFSQIWVLFSSGMTQRIRVHYERKSNDFHIFLLYLVNFNIENGMISFSFEELDTFQYIFTNIYSFLVDIMQCNDFHV